MKWLLKITVCFMLIGCSGKDNCCPSAKFLVGQMVSNERDFVEVDTIYGEKNTLLDPRVYKAFVRMADSANKAGIELYIISGYRSFYSQKRIWQRKWENNSATMNEQENVDHILKFSSMPGISRHHWGTDIDLNNLNSEYFESGEGALVYDWLNKNAHYFGFFQPYTSKENGRTGFETEEWHWSYLPLSKAYLDCYVQNDSIEGLIKGFNGARFYKTLDIKDNFVQGIEMPASTESIQ
jgi:LAS superfamily LD-carboxypeptidase LdcB